MERAGTPRTGLPALLAVLVALLLGGHLLPAAGPGRGAPLPASPSSAAAADALRGLTAPAVRAAPRTVAARAAARSAKGALRALVSVGASTERAVLSGQGGPSGPLLPLVPAWVAPPAGGCCPVLLPGQLPRPPDAAATGSSPHAVRGRAPPFSAGT